jgi:metallo-beta-lactamase class B
MPLPAPVTRAIFAVCIKSTIITYMLLRFLLMLVPIAAVAQNPAWTRPYPAHKVAGNVYYVGTEDLACFLIATPQGHILINTGLADSVPLIREGIQKMGYKIEDVKILLTMQAHFDHTAGLAEIQKISGAKMYATVQDTPVMEDGGKSDPLQQKYLFAPIKVARKLKHGDHIKLGGTDLTVYLTPGHTKGSVSYAMTVEDGGSKRSLLIANMESVVMPLVGNAWYPEIVKDYENTFRFQKTLSPEIWVAGHGSQYDMMRKHKAGSFVDPEGYKAAIADYERQFREKLAAQSKR